MHAVLRIITVCLWVWLPTFPLSLLRTSEHLPCFRQAEVARQKFSESPQELHLPEKEAVQPLLSPPLRDIIEEHST